MQLVRELAPRLPETRFVMPDVSTDDDDVLDAIEFRADRVPDQRRGDALLRAVRGAFARAWRSSPDGRQAGAPALRPARRAPSGHQPDLEHDLSTSAKCSDFSPMA